MLNAGEKAFVYVQYSYSGDGSYSINASATGINQGNQILSSMLENLEIGNLLITSFDAVNVLILQKQFLKFMQKILQMKQ